MKHGIAWYKDCLRNRRASYTRDEERIRRWQVDLDRQAEQIERLDKQIQRAEKEGKTAFDEERYLPLDELKK